MDFSEPINIIAVLLYAERVVLHREAAELIPNNLVNIIIHTAETDNLRQKLSITCTHIQPHMDRLFH